MHYSARLEIEVSILRYCTVEEPVFVEVQYDARSDDLPPGLTLPIGLRFHNLLTPIPQRREQLISMRGWHSNRLMEAGREIHVFPERLYRNVPDDIVTRFDDLNTLKGIDLFIRPLGLTVRWAEHTEGLGQRIPYPKIPESSRAGEVDYRFHEPFAILYGEIIDNHSTGPKIE